ncbi:hypothetical protein GCM10009836_62860 [Pseudonocardia ailaonensis]|uniref:DUF6924 domain-containing protein n=1 Tax=Pseudonocardia ailaonensis TaxID=367279 RepID=A0ABN2NPN4_9PSEU
MLSGSGATPEFERVATLVATPLGPPVATAARPVAARVSDGAAEALGRLGDNTSRRRPRRAVAAPHAVFPPPPAAVVDSSGSGLPGSVPSALAHRLLGAVETSLPDTGFAASVADVLGSTAGTAAADGTMAIARVAGGHDAFDLALQLAGFRIPAAGPMTTALLRALSATGPVADFLAVHTSEPAGAVAADHGRSWFAVAVVAAAVVVRAAEPGPTPGGEAALVVGLALRSAAELLRERPMPPTWAVAREAERRAGFRLPHMTAISLRADRGRIALLGPEGDAIPDLPAPADGVAAVAGGVVVHTGVGDVPVSVIVETTEHGPEADTQPSPHGDDWEHIVELSYDGAGSSRLLGQPMTTWPDARDLAFPWPGPVRARVHAAGRGSGGQEQYLIRLWEAGPAPTIVLRDRPVRPSLPAVHATALIRTDFADDAAWALAVTRLTTPNESGFVASLAVLEEERFAGATVVDLLELATPSWSRNWACLFVVDGETLASDDLPVLVVGLRREDRGRTFRVVARELWSVENNLSISNLDFRDFAGSTEDGVFRGFAG